MRNNEEFRDKIGTIDDSGNRKYIFPKKPKGYFYKYRKFLSYFLLTFFIAAPFLKVNGNQFLMFNVLERRFNIFGFPFFPQDFHLFVISMIIGVVFITLFTVVFGRIFCGWFCPQTIFMEMVFRRIEYFIDGDRLAQIKLSKQKWNAEKIVKRILKWMVFYAISFFIANIFLAYLVGSDELYLMIEQGPILQLGNFVVLLIFSCAFYFIFAWFREQVCIIACPYGRLQGVLLDNKSINVVYDFIRGEKKAGRAKLDKNENRETSGKGDCIDCKQCIHVCPTGIDIRNGTQLECINCTACMDECDSIMESVNLPKGLIRYATEDEIEKNEPFKFNWRMKGYAAVLTLLVGLLISLLSFRSDVEATVLRMPGELFTHEGDKIKNDYSYKIVNKTVNDYKDVHFKLISHSGEIKVVGSQHFVVPKNGMNEGNLFITIKEVKVDSYKTELIIGVFDGEKQIETATTNFLGPRTF